MRRRKAAVAPAVVFDTPLLLRALLLGDAAAQRLRRAWQQGQCRALVDAANARALMLALSSPALKLSVQQQHELLADYLPYAEVQQLAAPLPVATSSLTPFDRLALGLAQAAEARWLVSDSPALRARFSRNRTRAAGSAVELVASEDFLAGL